MEAAEFIKIHRESDTLDEVARKTGMKKNSVSVRATRYRKLGIVLPYLKGKWRPLLTPDFVKEMNRGFE